jgi:uncharacterized protein (TIGR02300 family)
VDQAECGTKRVCASCGSRFFDLRHEPIICPKCQAVSVVPASPALRPGRFVKRAAPVEQDPLVASLPEDLPEADDEETISPAIEEDENDLTEEDVE